MYMHKSSEVQIEQGKHNNCRLSLVYLVDDSNDTLKKKYVDKRIHPYARNKKKIGDANQIQDNRGAPKSQTNPFRPAVLSMLDSAQTP